MSSGNTSTHKYTTDEIKTLLELPFRAAEITWRVLGDGEKTEGQARIIPYAYRAAYMRRSTSCSAQEVGPNPSR